MQRHAALLDGDNAQSVKSRDICLVELSIFRADLGAHPSNTLQFQVKVFHESIERGCDPESAPIELLVPSEDAALVNWVV